MDCFASDASTLVGDAAPPLKHAAADVEYVKPEPAWDPKEAMRLHMRRKRDADKAEKIKNRSFIVDRVLAINRTREPDRSHSRSPARPYPHVSICRSFVKTGSCPYGAACSFEHPAPPTPPRAPTPKVQPPPPPPAPVQQQQPEQPAPKTVYLPVPAVPPMFYSTYRRGSNGELIDPALLPAPVQAQKSLYYRTKPCRYWAQDGACPKGDKCTFIHDPSLAPPAEPAAPAPVTTPLPQRRPSAAYAKPPREPHPAWRVVGGGVTLANARAQAGGNDTGADSEEEAAVECLTGLSASQSQQSQSQSYASQPSQPAYAPPPPPPASHSQPYAAQPAQTYATSPPPSQYAAPLPSPVLFDPAAPYALPAPPGQPVFAYAYPAPAYMWTPPPLPPGTQTDGGAFVYYVAAAPHALELGVPRVPAAVHALQDAGLDTSGLDGSGRPLDPGEAAQPLVLDVDEEGGEWHGEEDEELDVSQGSVLMDVEEESSFPWGAVEKLSWADDVEMEEAELRRAAHALDDGRRTSPTTPRGPTARLYELFAAAESP